MLCRYSILFHDSMVFERFQVSVSRFWKNFRVLKNQVRYALVELENGEDWFYSFQVFNAPIGSTLNGWRKIREGMSASRVYVSCRDEGDDEADSDDYSKSVIEGVSDYDILHDKFYDNFF